jgi:hypothetical protein
MKKGPPMSVVKMLIGISKDAAAREQSSTRSRNDPPRAMDAGRLLVLSGPMSIRMI